MEIFQGSDQSHGVLTVKVDGSFDHMTKEGAASLEDYEAHLAGKLGLGLVPVRIDGTCRFGALDIDDDSINHQLLYNKVKQYKMPLTVCRSRSGAAHLYVFIKEPGIKATKVVAALRRWGSILGFPSVEVFPKQLKIDSKHLGNWINLPYYGGNTTTRYAFGSDGSLLAEEFFDAIEWWDGTDTVEKAEQGLVVLNPTQMPPCLAHFTQTPLNKGERNNGLFNFAVYARKAFPNSWKEVVEEFNQKHTVNPLSPSELANILKSSDQVKYQYQCNQEPIVSHCNRKACLATPFGISHMPWKEKGSVGEFLISHLRKVNTDPPHFIVEVNGHDITLSNEEFYDFNRLRIRIEDQLDIVIPRMKADKWDAERHELHNGQEVIEAPDDASINGQTLSDVNDFLMRYNEARDDEDILKGTPIKKGNFICFKVADMVRFLRLHKRNYIENTQLYALLHANGCKFETSKIKGRSVKVWMYPMTKLNIQTEDFNVVPFLRTGETL
jgi:hypothetical protein